MLNSTKCAFGVKVGKFLGFVVTFNELNSKKFVLFWTCSPPNVSSMSRVAGRVAALSRFMSKAAYKSKPFSNHEKHKKISVG